MQLTKTRRHVLASWAGREHKPADANARYNQTFAAATYWLTERGLLEHVGNDWIPTEAGLAELG